MTKKLLLLILLSSLSYMTVQAIERKVFQQKVKPVGFDNNSYLMFYYNANKIYTIKGVQIFENLMIDDLKISPSKTSIATLQHNTFGIPFLLLYNLINDHSEIDYTGNNEMAKKLPTAVAYSANARQLAVSSIDRQIVFYDPLTIKPLKTYTSKIIPSKLVFSDNNYFLCAAKQDTLEIWNLDKDVIRTTLKAEASVRDMCFCDNSGKLLVLTSNGRLHVYDTKTFGLQYSISDLGQAVSCAPDLTGKYAAVVVNDKMISIVNILDPTERHIITDEAGGITTSKMIYHESKKKNYVLYNNSNAIVFNEVEGMKPYYHKMMTSELNERLNHRTRRLPNETMELYQLRVNDSTRIEQAKVIGQEIATRMATGLLELSEVAIGDYNLATNSLALKINSMPEIFISVPENEVHSFNKSNRLKFHNAKYILTSEDKFELVYAEVFNQNNGKTYVFDNTKQSSLSQLIMDTDFVPLEIIQKSYMEETALVNIKEDIFNLAKQEKMLSDKTQIAVKTGVENAVDAEGKKIINYNVDFTYEVEEAFSARDDFKPGRYHTEESNAAMIMLKIMTQAFEKDFAKYVTPGKQVKIKVKGTADASPIKRTLSYDGKYGEYFGEPVFMDSELNSLTLTKKDGITTNEQLAFARALGVQNYIEKKISAFNDMKRDYEYHIEVSKEKGSKYRRISVQYTFVNAL